jgi:hypothetical protein
MMVSTAYHFNGQRKKILWSRLIGGTVYARIPSPEAFENVRPSDEESSTNPEKPEIHSGEPKHHQGQSGNHQEKSGGHSEEPGHSGHHRKEPKENFGQAKLAIPAAARPDKGSEVSFLASFRGTDTPVCAPVFLFPRHGL